MIEIAFKTLEEKWALKPLFKSGEISLITAISTKQNVYPSAFTPAQIRDLEIKDRMENNQLESEACSSVWAAINKFNYQQNPNEQAAIMTLLPHQAPRLLSSLNDFAIWARDAMLMESEQKEQEGEQRKPVGYFPMEKRIIGISLTSLLLNYRKNKDDKLMDIACDLIHGTNRINFSFGGLQQVLESLSTLGLSIVLLATAVDVTILNLIAGNVDETIKDLVDNIFEVEASEVKNMEFTLNHVYKNPSSGRTEFIFYNYQ